MFACMYLVDCNTPPVDITPLNFNQFSKTVDTVGSLFIYVIGTIRERKGNEMKKTKT